MGTIGDGAAFSGVGASGVPSGSVTMSAVAGGKRHHVGHRVCTSNAFNVFHRYFPL